MAEISEIIYVELERNEVMHLGETGELGITPKEGTPILIRMIPDKKKEAVKNDKINTKSKHS